LSFKFWLGYKILTELAGLFFLKSKRRRFSKKTKKNKNQRVCNQVLTGSCRVNPSDHTGFFLPPFFLQLCPVPAPGRPDPGSTCQTGSDFKTIDETILASSLVVGLENLFLFSFYFECNELIFWIYKLHVKDQGVASFYFEGLFCTTTSFF